MKANTFEVFSVDSALVTVYIINLIILIIILMLVLPFSVFPATEIIAIKASNRIRHKEIN